MLRENNTSRHQNGERILTTRLQPMGFSDILDTTFSLYRNHFWLFLGVTTVYLVGELGQLLLGDFLEFFFSRSFLLGIAIVALTGTFLIIGIGGIVIATGATYLGENITIRSVLHQTIHKFWRLVGYSFLWSLVVGGLAITIIGIPFAIYFAVRWGFFVATVLLEPPLVKAAFRRSSELVRGMWWNIFGMFLAIYLLSTALHSIFEVSIGFIFVITELAGEIDFVQILEWAILSESIAGITPFFFVLTTAIHLAVNVVTFPIWGIGLTLLYFNQRIRKEGFDIEMQVPVS